MVNEAVQFLWSAVWSCSRRVGNRALIIASWIVFAILDVTDQLLCPVFAFLDSFLDSETRACYCRQSGILQKGGKQVANRGGEESLSQLSQLSQEGAFTDGDGHWLLHMWTCSSDTLSARVRRLGRTRFHLLALHRTLSGESSNNSPQFNIPCEGIVSQRILNDPVGSDGDAETIVQPVVGRDLSNLQRGTILPTVTARRRNWTERSLKSLKRRKSEAKPAARWSDCGCQQCTSWQSEKDQLLYVHVDDKDFLASVGRNPIAASVAAAENNVIFFHGFLSSSSFWDTVLPALPESLRTSHRLFAVDIMGFGRSPKPSNSSYTIAEHIDMIRRSVLERYGIQKFHLVAHSMGCTVALAFAANYPSALKSITLIAPPYCPDVSGESSSTYVMKQLSARKIWPLFTFAASVMSWYEHIGRVVCFVVCKHHRLWEPLLFFVHSKLPGTRTPSSCVTDFTRHTHQSAWHVFHNTICNGGLAADRSLEVLQKAGKRVRVIHGTRDAVIPFKSSVSLVERHPNVRLTTVTSADHGTVVFGREAQLAEELAEEILMI